jgi:betaine-aldehyde dehydrogenase
MNDTSMTTTNYALGGEPAAAPASLCLVGGERVPAISGEWLDAVNPATGETIGRIPRCDERDADRAAAEASRAFRTWRATGPLERARLLRAFADAIERRGDELARLDAMDNGSPLREMRADVDIAVEQIRYLSGLVLEARGQTMPETPGRLHFTTREP